jgi:CRISPR-associated protein Cas1
MSTVVIHTQGTLVEARGDHLRVLTPDGLRRELPLVGVDRVHCYGKVQVTTQAIHLLARHGKELVYFSRRGRLRARLIHNPTAGVDLRRAQYAWADAGCGLAIARGLIAAKVANQRAVLLRGWRNREELRDPALLERLNALEDETKAADPDALFGIEGTAARLYFNAWAALCGDAFPWQGRNRRPPRDPLNVLLSLGYTILIGDVQAQCEALGLDVWLGFLHQVRPGRPALALDLAEPFRPILVDRVIIDLISHRRIHPEHFHHEAAGPHARDPDRLEDADDAEADGGTISLADEGFRIYLTALERRLTHEDAEDGSVTGLRAELHGQIGALASALRAGDPAAFAPRRLAT